MTEPEATTHSTRRPSAADYLRAPPESLSCYDEYPFSRSKMLEGYGADIERLLMERHVRMALRVALNLPAIATALEDENLLTAAKSYADWCDEWLALGEVGRPFAACSGADLHALFVRHGDAPGSADRQFPRRALKALQLRRHARASSAGIEYLDAELDAICAGSPRARLALEMRRGMRRWYAAKAITDRRVQGNLAKIAVLR
jgi:hypothetical protein